LKGRDIKKKKEISKEMREKKNPAQKKARAGTLLLSPTTSTGPFLPPSSSFRRPSTPSAPPAAFPSPRVVLRRRHRSKLGAEAFVGLFFAGDEHPPGTPTPPLPFPSLHAVRS